MTPTDLASQTDSTAAAVPGFCWRARPLPRCETFPITDFALSTTLFTTRSDPDPTFGLGNYPDFQNAMRWTVGLMHNRRPRQTGSYGTLIAGGLMAAWVALILIAVGAGY